MNVLQRIKLTMYMMVKDCLTTNATIVANLPGYAANFTTLQNNIVQIQATGELQQFDKTGIGDSKKVLKQTLVLQAVDISRKMVAYANNVGNAILLKEVNYTKSELNRAPDAELKNIVQCIYDRANANLTALAPYGIVAATLTTFLAAIGSFNTAIPKPQEGIIDKKLSTSQLMDYYKATDLALDSIDKIVEIVHLTQPNFYKNYKDCRKLRNIGGGSVSLKGLVIESVSGEHIKGATVVITPDGGKAAVVANSNGNKTVKKTAEKGGFIVKSLASGTYRATVSKAGYADAVATISVNDGEMTVLEIAMEKA